MFNVGKMNQNTPVVSPGYGYNQLPTCQSILGGSCGSGSSAVTWSIMTDIGGDLPCSSTLNDSLNRLPPYYGEIHYKINGYSYTTKKVNPYTAIQTNDITKQQRTLKSSVWDNNPDLSSDNPNEYKDIIEKLGAENIDKWYLYNDNNCKQFIDVFLSFKLSLLPIGGSIFHDKRRGFMYNFIKNSITEVFQRNVITGKNRTLHLDIDDNDKNNNNNNNNSKNVNQHNNNNNANSSSNNAQISNPINNNNNNNNNNQKTFTNQKCWCFKRNDGTFEKVDVILCEKFSNLNIGDKFTYFSDCYEYEAFVISNCLIKQTNLKTGTKRDIIATATAPTTPVTTSATAPVTNNHTNDTNHNGYTINCNFTMANVNVAIPNNNTFKSNCNSSSTTDDDQSASNIVTNPKPTQLQFNSTHKYNTNTNTNTNQITNPMINPIPTNTKFRSKSKSKSKCKSTSKCQSSVTSHNPKMNMNQSQRNLLPPPYISNNYNNWNLNTYANYMYNNMTNNSNNNNNNSNCDCECKCNSQMDNSKKSSLSSDNYKKLKNLSKEEIERMFFGVNGVDLNYYKITSIDEINEAQVKMIEGIYNSQINRVRISQKKQNNVSNGKELETEKWLWHGTNVQVVDKILANGFDRNYNTMSAYGKGVYFARDSSYSRLYCENHNETIHNGDLCMLLCKVIVGDVIKGKYNMKKIPYKKDGVTQFETLVDNVQNPTIYVVTRDFMVVPKYKIWFRLKSPKNT